MLCHGANYNLQLMWQSNGDQRLSHALLRDKAEPGLARPGTAEDKLTVSGAHTHTQNIHNTDELSEREDAEGPCWLIKLVM